MCVNGGYDGEIWNLNSPKTDAEGAKLLNRKLRCWKNVCVGQYKVDRIWNFISIKMIKWWVNEKFAFFFDKTVSDHIFYFILIYRLNVIPAIIIAGLHWWCQTSYSTNFWMYNDPCIVDCHKII